jgi:hypothetical protein
MPPVSLLTPLTPDERTTFLVVALPQKHLLKLVGRLGTAPSGTRLDGLSVWDLAWSIVDYYENDAEVASTVDRTLRKELGRSPLVDAVAAAGGAGAVTGLLLESRDPARDLAWAILAAGGENTGELASSLVKTIIAEYDEADARAKEEEEARAAEPEAEPAPEADKATDEIAREAARARTARARALKRLGGLKERLVELEKGLATARQDARRAVEARERAEAERDRLVEERDALRGRVQTGTAAEVARLTEEREASERRLRALENELEEVRESEAALEARVRTLSETRPAVSGEEEVDRPAASGAAWSLPIFTDEFYESIRRWDRKIVRITFEKIYRLAEDWRHPSLRAIPLEGLPDCFRIRIASDVRLIYRPLDGGRVEILSLIDREDLTRYIRRAKTR